MARETDIHCSFSISIALILGSDKAETDAPKEAEKSRDMGGSKRPPSRTSREVVEAAGSRKRAHRRKTSRDFEGAPGFRSVAYNALCSIAMLQSELYAAEGILHAFWVTHVVDLDIVNDVAYLWYYDDLQAFRTNLLRDLPSFLILLFALRRFILQNWGVMKEFQEVEIAAGLQAHSDENIPLYCFST
ncbi:hypothetical protein BD779DRAFT_1678730 [Infundibulicybe gibba]|nr:hypothetical protein BD779DRAFT_1678730 [Infundibulicybe gibba]